MPEIKVAFWNVENLFDTTASDIAADMEFTLAEGWTEEAFATKVKNLASIIKMLHGGQGPDLLGLCEVETKGTVEALLAEIGRPDYKIAHVESPDIRGIDASLVYSDKIFNWGVQFTQQSTTFCGRRLLLSLSHHNILWLLSQLHTPEYLKSRRPPT